MISMHIKTFWSRSESGSRDRDWTRGAHSLVPKLDADTVLQLLLLESVIPTRTLRNLGECYEGRRALPRDKCIEKIEREGRVDSIIKSLSNNADLETIAAKRTKIGFVFPKYGTDNVLNLWNSLLENIPKRPPLSVSMNGDSPVSYTHLTLPTN